jgi:peroxiredoxin
VAEAHGAQRPLVGTSRAVVIVDEQGVVRHRHDSRLGPTYQTADDLRTALDSPPARATRE